LWIDRSLARGLSSGEGAEMPESELYDMDFSQRLAALSKQKGLTQKALAEIVQGSLIQLRRYEAGTSQPTLDVIRNLPVALSVTADEQIFEKDERGPDDLRLQFEAISRFDPETKKVAKEILDSLILKQEARRWTASG
jgi:transcriptional regulator with XRE-family HTH domain